MPHYCTKTWDVVVPKLDGWGTSRHHPVQHSVVWRASYFIELTVLECLWAKKWLRSAGFVISRMMVHISGELSEDWLVGSVDSMWERAISLRYSSAKCLAIRTNFERKCDSSQMMSFTMQAWRDIGSVESRLSRERELKSGLTLEAHLNRRLIETFSDLVQPQNSCVQLGARRKVMPATVKGHIVDQCAAHNFDNFDEDRIHDLGGVRNIDNFSETSCFPDSRDLHFGIGTQQQGHVTGNKRCRRGWSCWDGVQHRVDGWLSVYHQLRIRASKVVTIIVAQHAGRPVSLPLHGGCRGLDPVIGRNGFWGNTTMERERDDRGGPGLGSEANSGLWWNGCEIVGRFCCWWWRRGR